MGQKVAKSGRVVAQSNLMPMRVEVVGSESLESASGVVHGLCWRGMLIGMLWGKAPKAGMGGAGWVKSPMFIAAKMVVISMMSAMWWLLWGYALALTRAMQ